MNIPPFLEDPFRFFFPLGWFAGLLGVGLWLPLAVGNFEFYPVESHRFIMIGGFLLSFVTGFLATAIPRFTSSWHLQRWEFLLLITGLLGAIVFASLAIASLHYAFVLLTLLVLIVFTTRRFQNRDDNPPSTFIFVGAGLLLWVIASFSLFLNQFNFSPSFIHAPARAIYIHGALLCLVIGVGGRLIPGILGWKSVVVTQRSRYENAESYQEAVPGSMWLVLSVFLTSYAIEGPVRPQLLWLLRGSVISFLAIRYWKLYLPPNQQSGFTWGIWIACWSFVVGMLIPVSWPSGGIHGIHMTFIGGFSLLTILVATRVTLAHGTRGKKLESTSLILKILIGLFILSAFSRVTAIIWPRTYLSHLGYASLLWIVGMVLWAYIFIPRMIGDYETSSKRT